MLEVLMVGAVVGGGLVAGVLFAVALSVVPALAALPVDRYVVTHRLLGRNWDPTMPLIVLTTLAVNVVLALLVDGRTSAVLFGLAAVFLLGVSGVSHLCNVPINRRVKAVDPDRMPSDWRDPRIVWRRWHLLRTWLAGVAAAATAAAVVLAG
ncbi:anthrone oxygenase family protein [Micromonospora sp. LOL_021]|uniref:anthrone oxygenase family protein n=1 Tax=Micromonospora sp. LOL_021 TaxID=3345417 RepID=UPI003A8632D2